MKNMIVFSLLAIFISVTGLSTTAEAKRFGGGMSFGKSFKKQKSFSKPAPQQGIGKQKSAPTQGVNSGSRTGGMMGMLGGLAMGGLLGAMFFGGAFDGINLFDILLIGGIAFAIFWFMRRTLSARREAYAHTAGMPAEPTQNNDTFIGEEVTTEEAKPQLDEAQFLESAKAIFMRMQADWDTKNEEDIRQFCTPDVANHVIAQIQGLGDNVTRTEVVVLYADLAGTWFESGLEWAAVHFQATFKEKTLDNGGVVIHAEDTHINEVWVFQHHPNSDDPTWYLSGIQQVDTQEI